MNTPELKYFDYQVPEYPGDAAAAELRIGRWLDRTHRKAISLIGREQYQEDWAAMWAANEGDPLGMEADVRKYAEFLNAIDAAAYTDRQIREIKAEIAESQEKGNYRKAFALRDLLVRYVRRPELQGVAA